MTVIIVGPIVLALSIPGLHIMNRYAEEEGTKEEKIAKAMNSTEGRAPLAITTIIGFISHLHTHGTHRHRGLLSGGILVVYV